MGEPNESPTHIIVLVQFSENINSRTYLDFDFLSQALDGVCQLYERECKLCITSQSSKLTYSLDELLNYIDSLHDICFLCEIVSATRRTSKGASYVARGKPWIQNKLTTRLRSQIHG